VPVFEINTAVYKTKEIIKTMNNWLSNFIRPRINPFGNKAKDVPDNLWEKCPSCDGMLFHRDLKAAQNVCYHCGYHLRIDVIDRLKNLFDDGQFNEYQVRNVPVDPLKFKDKKKYIDRLTESQKKRGRKDAIVVADGTIKGQPCMVAAFDFAFMGGSMGAGVGEGIVLAAEKAVKKNIPLLVIPSSGGARMQEAALSLMQMPRSIVAVEMVKDAGLPYLVLLTDPTTGGVSASFAMLGDIQIAEPGATIGFAGKRVIQETIREELPDGFQTAEYLLSHGMVDMVVARDKQPETIGRILDMLMNPKRNLPSGGKKSTLKSVTDKVVTSIPLPDVARGGNQTRLGMTETKKVASK
jgi:acetyl-CoA carboxylase carboxyl transferase subunit beta